MKIPRLVTGGFLAVVFAASAAAAQGAFLSCAESGPAGGSMVVSLQRHGDKNFTASITAPGRAPETIPNMNCHKPEITFSDDFGALQVGRFLCEQEHYDAAGKARSLWIDFDRAAGGHSIVESVYSGTPGARSDEQVPEHRETVSAESLGDGFACRVNAGQSSAPVIRR